MTYVHTGLSEWYSNGPLGLEQGFTIPHPPSGHPAGPLTLSIALSGNAHVSRAAGGRSLTLSYPGAASLRYTDVTAADAHGRKLRSWLELRGGGQILLRVDTHAARYPLRIDPFVQQAKLFASDEAGSAKFGSSVALSADGNTALIGGPEDNKGVGAAWVFTRAGSIWTQQGEKLTGGGESGKGGLGGSVALSADGNTALIGGGADNGYVGAMWVFTRSGSTWTQQGEKLTGGGESGTASFGHSVALSADGNTALIGGQGDNQLLGAAWAFTRSGSTWTQQGPKLTSGNYRLNGSVEFGASVALSADGSTALIGGPEYVGAAWVFTRAGSSWAQQGPILTGGGEVNGYSGGHFGSAVALSADGNTALIGGHRDNWDVGAAWVFTRAGSTWTQQPEKLTGGGESGKGQFGRRVALSSDGNTALIGGLGDNGYDGAMWAFTRSGSTWTQQGEKLTGGGESGTASFGDSVALSADGNTALIGGGGDNEHLGAAWVFTRSGSTWTQQGEKLTGKGEADGDFGSGVALSADGNTALVGAPEDDSWTGAAWVFRRSGTTWTQQGPKLTGGGEIGSGRLGTSVALSSDGKTALIGGPGDNNSVGAAWVFTPAGPTWRQRGAKLTGGGESGPGGFGESIALSSDGKAALIGGPGDNERDGAAWVFTRAGARWTPRGPKLTGGGEENSVDAEVEYYEEGYGWHHETTHVQYGGRFGESVALSADGSTALIGAPRDDTDQQCGGCQLSEAYLASQGAVWAFARSGSTWTQQGEKFTRGSSPPGVQFGESLVLSADGNTALVGGPGSCCFGNGGVAWVFTRAGATWTQHEELTNPEPREGQGHFGVRLALSADGSTALILNGGGFYEEPVGAAWVFTRSASTWTQGEKLTCGPEGCGDVALSGDGNTALVGRLVFG